MSDLVRLLTVGAGVVLLVGCAGFFSSTPSPVDLRFQDGLQAVDRGDFETAEATFQELASHCESGNRGRSALLLLSTLALDVRNPWQDPDRAALFASAYLRLPEAPPEDLSLARTLYLLALDQGAKPLVRDSTGLQEEAADSSALATRFSNCGRGGVVEWVRVLPTHPGPRAVDRLQAARSERDSLEARSDSLARALRASRRQIEDLQAELERIRKLLKGGGGRSSPERR